MKDGPTKLDVESRSTRLKKDNPVAKKRVTEGKRKNETISVKTFFIAGNYIDASKKGGAVR